MAYGQTSAGKTFSLFGDARSSDREGLVPRFAWRLFAQLADLEACASDSALLRASFFEIHNEKIFDLSGNLMDVEGGEEIASPVALQLRESAERGVYVDQLRAEVCGSAEETLSRLNAALQRRKVNETLMNARSSRSHFVCTFELELLAKLDCAEETKEGVRGERNGNGSRRYEITRRSRIVFVDLAGSERQRTNAGETLLEGCHINRSLSVLQHVLAGLARKGAPEFVHYRDSKFANKTDAFSKGNF